MTLCTPAKLLNDYSQGTFLLVVVHDSTEGLSFLIDGQWQIKKTLLSPDNKRLGLA